MSDTPLGITTTLPVEIAVAAGRRVLDLNNVFVADPDPARLVEAAERRGFPQSACAWIKGIYGAIHHHAIREVIGVVEGDCAETGALLDILVSEGVGVHPFAYPHTRDPADLAREMDRLAAALGTTRDAAEAAKAELDDIRRRAGEIDRLAAATGGVRSDILFGSLLACTDFLGNPSECRADLDATLDELGVVREDPGPLRLGCLGVPPILSDFWDVFEGGGARFVFHEVPRQFALLDGIGRSLPEAYAAYTYPYDVFARIEDIRRAAEARRLAGLVHYVQSFCHRQILDRLLRERLPLPILTVEADRPGPVDGRTRTRIEAFLEQLRG